MPSSGLTKKERLDLFLQALKELPVAHDGEEAYQQVCDTLNRIEGENTDIPNRPELWQTDGRIYPPQKDSSRRIEGHSDVIRYRSKGHNTYIKDNGAIEIALNDPKKPYFQGEILLSKIGDDGHGVEL